MLKRFQLFLIGLLFAIGATAQTFPVVNINVTGNLQAAGNPGSIGNVFTSNGTATPSWAPLTGLIPTNSITFSQIAQAAANTVLGNGTGSTANLAALAVPSCSTATSALQWTSGTGFGCGNSFLSTTALNTALPSATTYQLYGGTGAAGTARVIATPIYWAQSYNIKCDGSTNDTTATQALVNAIITAGGGTIEFPAGTCLIPGGITENLTSYSSYEKPFVHLRGQGATATRLTANSLVGAAITITGNTTNDVAYVDLDNLTIQGNSTTGSIGLSTTDTAYLHLTNITIQGFTTGWTASDLEQSVVTHSNFVFNGNAIILNGVVNQTGSNSLSFYDTAIANSTSSGILVKDFAAVSFYNGSIQYNGAVGVSGNHGAFFQDTAGGNVCGYNTISFYGTVFEGNGGDYDLDMQTNFCPGAALTLSGVSFIRTTGYATNNIRVDGTQSQTITLSGTTFVYNSSYTPNGSRPNINLANNAASIIYDNGSNYFQSAIEGPLYPAAQSGFPAPSQGAWTAWTPVISCGAGSMTAGSASGRYKRLGQKTIAAQISLTVTTVGTCSAGVNLTLPAGITVNATGNIYPADIVDGTAGGIAAGVIFHNGGTDIAVLYGTPLAHVYYLNGIFETP